VRGEYLAKTLMRVQHDMLVNPKADPNPFIRRYLEPTVAWLDLTL